MTQATTTKKSRSSYTEEETKSILQKWDEFKSANPKWFEGERVEVTAFIESLAKAYGKTARMIISKLSRSNVGYVAKTYTNKNGEVPAKKDEVADFIGKVLQLSEADTDSLTKANKSALAKIRDALASNVPIETLTPAEEVQRSTLAQNIGTYCSLDNPGILQRLPLKDLQQINDSL